MTEITTAKSRGSGGVLAPGAGAGWALRLLAPLALMAVIFWFSAQPYDGDEMAWWEVAGRNLGHFLGYAMLTAAWAWALPRRLRTRLLLAVAFALAYAASDEYHQTFVDGRTGTIDDVVIDALGMATAALLIGFQARRSAAGGGDS